MPYQRQAEKGEPLELRTVNQVCQQKAQAKADAHGEQPAAGRLWQRSAKTQKTTRVFCQRELDETARKRGVELAELGARKMFGCLVATDGRSEDQENGEETNCARGDHVMQGNRSLTIGKQFTLM